MFNTKGEPRQRAQAVFHRPRDKEGKYGPMQYVPEMISGRGAAKVMAMAEAKPSLLKNSKNAKDIDEDEQAKYRADLILAADAYRKTAVGDLEDIPPNLYNVANAAGQDDAEFVQEVINIFNPSYDKKNTTWSEVKAQTLAMIRKQLGEASEVRDRVNKLERNEEHVKNDMRIRKDEARLQQRSIEALQIQVNALHVQLRDRAIAAEVGSDQSHQTAPTSSRRRHGSHSSSGPNKALREMLPPFS